MPSKNSERESASLSGGEPSLLPTESHAEGIQQWIPRDGDAMLTEEGFIFYVIGYLHPIERVVSYLKYVPKKLAKEFKLRWLPYEWNLDNVKLVRPEKLYTPDNYGRIIKVFEDYHPEYVVYDPNLKKSILMTPKSSIEAVYEPSLSLAKLLERKNKGTLDSLETAAIEMIEYLSKQTGVS